MKDNKQHKKLPRLAEFFIRKILPDEGRDSPVGDFEEDFNEIVSEAGVQRAWIWYFTQILILLPQKTFFSIQWSFAMFKNNLKVVLQNIKRQKGYSFINIFGLAVGMAICILILLYVNFELSYDKYHKNAGNIYRVYSRYKIGETYRQPACVPGAVGPALSENIPLVKDYVKIFNPLMFEKSTIIKYGESLFEESEFLAVDPNFFEYFTYEFIKGNAKNAINEPGSVVITEQTAKKIFGDKNPIGESLEIDNDFLSPT
ncbi:ABC transporter permease, partial [candidate division KSB1 bacterium]